jgi:hypothetical protein
VNRLHGRGSIVLRRDDVRLEWRDLVQRDDLQRPGSRHRHERALLQIGRDENELGAQRRFDVERGHSTAFSGRGRDSCLEIPSKEPSSLKSASTMFA